MNYSDTKSWSVRRYTLNDATLEGEYRPIYTRKDVALEDERPSYTRKDGSDGEYQPVLSRQSEGSESDHLSPKRALSRQLTGGRSQPKIEKAERMSQLTNVAEGLITKLYLLRRTLDLPNGPLKTTDTAWKAGIFPQVPKLCMHLAKKFPEHPRRLQLEKVDKAAFEIVRALAEKYLRALEPWYLVLVDLLTFRKLALKLLLDISNSGFIQDPFKNPLLLHGFMELFCSFIRVHMMLEKTGRKLIVQVYAMLYDFTTNGEDPEDHRRLVAYLSTNDPPIHGIQMDLSPFGPQVGKILEILGPKVSQFDDLDLVRSKGFLNTWWPSEDWQPPPEEKSRDFIHFETYRLWLLYGYLACPLEILKGQSSDLLASVLQTTYVIPLFRDEVLYIHEEYLTNVLPKLLTAAQGLPSDEADSVDHSDHYQIFKLVKTKLRKAFEEALNSMAQIHSQRRVMLQHELQRLLLLLSHDPTVLAPNISVVFSTLSLARSELLWYFQHAGVVMVGDRSTSDDGVLAVDLDIPDNTIGSLLHFSFQLSNLVHKYSSGRMQTLMERESFKDLPWNVALRPLVNNLKETVNDLLQVMEEAEDDVTAGGVPISWETFREDWFRLSSSLSSRDSPVTLQMVEEVEEITIGGDMHINLVDTCNRAYLWSRQVDKLDDVIRECSSFKALCFYRHNLVTVFKYSMFGAQGFPQHCPSWMSLAWAFLENIHPSAPEEAARLKKAAVDYANSLLEALMGGVDFLLTFLDSSSGLRGLSMKLEVHHAAMLMMYLRTIGSVKQKHVTSAMLPGDESQPHKNDLNSLERALHKLTALVSVLNNMEPVTIVGRVFVPREYLRERIATNIRKHIRDSIESNGDFNSPSKFELSLNQYTALLHVIDQHCNTDLTNTLRETLLFESFTGPMRDLHQVGVQIANSNTPMVEIFNKSIIQNIVCDSKNLGVVFSPFERSFHSTVPIQGGLEKLSLSVPDLESFVRNFGPYGVDKVTLELKEILTVLLTRFESVLRENKASLIALAANMHQEQKRRICLKKISNLELSVAICIQVGHCLTFLDLLSDASSHVLQKSTPLIFTTLQSMAMYVPRGAPENGHVAQIRRIAGRVGAMRKTENTSPDILSILLDIGGVGDSTWALLPYFFGAFMTSEVWKGAFFNCVTGGFSNNVNCLARSIHSLIEGSENAGSERRDLKRELLAQQRAARGKTAYGDGYEEEEMGSTASLEDTIQRRMQIFVQCGACHVLSDWEKDPRSPILSQTIFLDQLCEFSQYLPRSILEAHIPRTLIKSSYQKFHLEKTSSETSNLSVEARGPTAALHLADLFPNLMRKGEVEENFFPNRSSSKISRYYSEPLGLGELVEESYGMRDSRKTEEENGKNERGNEDREEKRTKSGSFFSGQLPFNLSRKNSQRNEEEFQSPEKNKSDFDARQARRRGTGLIPPNSSPAEDAKAPRGREKGRSRVRSLSWGSVENAVPPRGGNKKESTEPSEVEPVQVSQAEEDDFVLKIKSLKTLMLPRRRLADSDGEPSPPARRRPPTIENYEI